MTVECGSQLPEQQAGMESSMQVEDLTSAGTWTLHLLQQEGRWRWRQRAGGLRHAVVGAMGTFSDISSIFLNFFSSINIF